MRRPSRRRRLGLVLSAVVVVATPALGTAAWARSSSQRTATQTVSSATLAPPTGLGFTKSCSPTNGSSSVTLTWTASSSAYATGYVVTYTQNGSSSGTTPFTVAGGGTTSWKSPSIANGVSYVATVSTTYKNWTSAGNPSTTAFSCP